MERLAAVRGAAAAILAAVVLLVTAGCGHPGNPRTLVPGESAQRPMPANAGVNHDPPKGSSSDEDCDDPTASLAPDGTDVPSGSTMAEILDRGRLIVGVDQGMNLFSYRDPATGELEGFDVDIAREIAGELLGDRDKVQFKTVTVDKRIPALVDGDVDIVVFAMTITCQRREQIEFSSVYYEAGQRVLVPKGSGWKGIDDLEGRKVCAPRGSTSSVTIASAESRPILVEVDGLSDCLVMMQQGQVDAFSTDDSILAGMAQQDPATEVVGDRIHPEPYGIGIPKGDKDMVRYVNAVLDKLRAGRWQQLHAKWLEPVLGKADPPKPKYR